MKCLQGKGDYSRNVKASSVINGDTNMQGNLSFSEALDQTARPGVSKKTQRRPPAVFLSLTRVNISDETFKTSVTERNR